MIKAVIFDLDGTLVNTLPDLAFITNTTLTDLGFPKRSEEEVRMFIGNGMKKLISRALPEGVTLTQDILDLMQANYLKYQNRLSTVYDGVPTMLDELHSRGIRTAIVTNKPHAAALAVTEKYFGDLIDLTQGQEAGIPVKPAPDTGNIILRKLNLKPEEAVYAGDSDTDILTGRNLKMPVLSCTWGFRSESFLAEHGAEYFVHHPSEIPQAIERIQQQFSAVK